MDRIYWVLCLCLVAPLWGCDSSASLHTPTFEGAFTEAANPRVRELERALNRSIVPCYVGDGMACGDNNDCGASVAENWDWLGMDGEPDPMWISMYVFCHETGDSEHGLGCRCLVGPPGLPPEDADNSATSSTPPPIPPPGPACKKHADCEVDGDLCTVDKCIAGNCVETENKHITCGQITDSCSSWTCDPTTGGCKSAAFVPVPPACTGSGGSGSSGSGPQTPYDQMCNGFNIVGVPDADEADVPGTLLPANVNDDNGNNIADFVDSYWREPDFSDPQIIPITIPSCPLWGEFNIRVSAFGLSIFDENGFDRLRGDQEIYPTPCSDEERTWYIENSYYYPYLGEDAGRYYGWESLLEWHWLGDSYRRGECRDWLRVFDGGGTISVDSDNNNGPFLPEFNWREEYLEDEDGKPGNYLRPFSGDLSEPHPGYAHPVYIKFATYALNATAYRLVKQDANDVLHMYDDAGDKIVFDASGATAWIEEPAGGGLVEKSYQVMVTEETGEGEIRITLELDYLEDTYEPNHTDTIRLTGKHCRTCDIGDIMGDALFFVHRDDFSSADLGLPVIAPPSDFVNFLDHDGYTEELNRKINEGYFALDRHARNYGYFPAEHAEVSDLVQVQTSWAGPGALASANAGASIDQLDAFIPNLADHLLFLMGAPDACEPDGFDPGFLGELITNLNSLMNDSTYVMAIAVLEHMSGVTMAELMQNAEAALCAAPGAAGELVLGALPWVSCDPFPVLDFLFSSCQLAGNLDAIGESMVFYLPTMHELNKTLKTGNVHIYLSMSSIFMHRFETWSAAPTGVIEDDDFDVPLSSQWPDTFGYAADHMEFANLVRMLSMEIDVLEDPHGLRVGAHIRNSHPQYWEQAINDRKALREDLQWLSIYSMAMYEQTLLQNIIESFPVYGPVGGTIRELFPAVTPHMPMHYSSNGTFQLMSGYTDAGVVADWGDYGMRMGLGTGEAPGARQLETAAELSEILNLRSGSGTTWLGTIPHFFTIADPAIVSAMHSTSWSPVCAPLLAPEIVFPQGEAQPPRVCYSNLQFGW